MPKAVEVSVVSPVFMAENLIDTLIGEIFAVLKDKRIEVILVDDGSWDCSWQRIQEICHKNPFVRGVLLSRNFGQHYAISAGLLYAKGQKIIVMDCDLQDRPKEIPRLLAKAAEGFDIVLARRVQRNDALWKRAGSWCFYKILEYLTDSRQDPAVGNFGVYDRRVINAINSLPETIRYFPTMVRWVGFRRTSLEVEHQRRPTGQSSYQPHQLFRLALDICLANSDKPLRVVVLAGFAVSTLGFVFALFTAWQALCGKIQVLGYASLMVSLWFLTGLTIMIVGIVGLYVGKSFEGIKRRPAFVVSSRVNFESTTPEN